MFINGERIKETGLPKNTNVLIIYTPPDHPKCISFFLQTKTNKGSSLVNQSVIFRKIWYFFFYLQIINAYLGPAWFDSQQRDTCRKNRPIVDKFVLKFYPLIVFCYFGLLKTIYSESHSLALKNEKSFFSKTFISLQLNKERHIDFGV